MNGKILRGKNTQEKLKSKKKHTRARFQNKTGNKTINPRIMTVCAFSVAASKKNLLMLQYEASVCLSLAIKYNSDSDTVIKC